MRKYLLFVALLWQSTSLLAQEHQIKMLDFGKDGGMVFEPGFIAVEPGDTITFIPTTSGHFVRSSLVPDGATEWLSAMDEQYSVTVEKEGVYVYYCPPHLSMAMLGVIQVGHAIGKEQVTEKMKSFNRRQLMNKQRIWSYLDQVEWTEQ
ncbi:pseudoazurin (plasmid) [Vibrio coralliilyticus]|uniref:pseudoazurin n=1 Tax=Vibrio coralliilyticus TaxID=190893 RepID=UPI0005126DEB|nr:pseudoazurin [Vibrio coralliilyticus]AIS58269.1 pseudoazurin [Vibrio coralliilyticus]